MNDQNPYDNAPPSLDIWINRIERARFPEAFNYESDLSLSEAADRLRRLAHPPSNLFAAEWLVELGETSEGLPLKVQLLRKNSSRSGRSRKYPTVTAEGLLRHDEASGKTLLHGHIKLGLEALFGAVIAVVAITTFWLISLAQTGMSRSVFSFVMWTIVLGIIPVYLWARLLRDRYELKQTLKKLMQA